MAGLLRLFPKDDLLKLCNWKPFFPSISTVDAINYGLTGISAAVNLLDPVLKRHKYKRL